MQLVQEKENSEFEPVKLRLKIDLVSYPARAEGLVNMNRFSDFRQDRIKLKFFVQPFDLAVEDSPGDCQTELTELLANMDTKRKYSEKNLVDFYKLYVSQFVPSCKKTVLSLW